MDVADEPQVRQTDVIGCVRRCLDHAHRSHAQRQRPYVTVTYAQSLDGSIAHAQGQTLNLSNEHSLRLTHQVRAEHDGILVGINTVMRDNPRLSVRLVEGKNPQPIVIDGRLRFPCDAHLLQDPCIRPIIFTSHEACETRAQRLLDAGARVVRVAQDAEGLLDLGHLFEYLKQNLGLRSVMVEGGATVITNLLTKRLADQFLITISPKLVGGLRSIHAQTNLDEIPQLRNLCYQWLGADLILRGDVETGEDRGADEGSAVV